METHSEWAGGEQARSLPGFDQQADLTQLWQGASERAWQARQSLHLPADCPHSGPAPSLNPRSSLVIQAHMTDDEEVTKHHKRTAGLTPALAAPQAPLVVKSTPASAGDVRRCGLNPWVGESPWRHPTPVCLPGEAPGKRSLVGCRPCGRRVGHD